jgi:hypothetical protein
LSSIRPLHNSIQFGLNLSFSPIKSAFFTPVSLNLKALFHAAFGPEGLCRFLPYRAHWNAGYSHFGGMLSNALQNTPQAVNIFAINDVQSLGSDS